MARQLDRLAKERGKTRAAVLRDLVERGLAESRLEQAIRSYREGRLSVGRAAEEAGVPYLRFLDRLQEQRIPVPLAYGLKEAEQDVAQATGHQ